MANKRLINNDLRSLDAGRLSVADADRRIAAQWAIRLEDGRSNARRCPLKQHRVLPLSSSYRLNPKNLKGFESNGNC